MTHPRLRGTAPNEGIFIFLNLHLFFGRVLYLQFSVWTTSSVAFVRISVPLVTAFGEESMVMVRLITVLAFSVYFRAMVALAESSETAPHSDGNRSEAHPSDQTDVVVNS
ncbi:MAG: hypothetical protein RXR52_41570 [Paraburkholderia sp.]|uniref:hypothetical protein n=1 Tax=Paraburkholderia sp. TaxID=1926495 RepID=UPI00397E02E9